MFDVLTVDLRPLARIAVSSSASLSKSDTCLRERVCHHGRAPASTGFHPLLLPRFRAWPQILHVIARDTRCDSLRQQTWLREQAASKSLDRQLYAVARRRGLAHAVQTV